MGNQTTQMPTVAREGKQVPLSKANKDQLKAFCIELGLAVQNFDTEDRLRKKILSFGWMHPFIVVYPDEAEAPKITKRAANKETSEGGDGDEADEPVSMFDPNRPLPKMSEPMVEIRLLNGEGNSGKRPLFVGVNGTGILIPRMNPCQVKYRYWAVLQNAIETQYPWDEENDCIGDPMDVPAYPHETIRKDDDAIDAWNKYNAEVQRREVEAKKAKEERRYAPAA